VWRGSQSSAQKSPAREYYSNQMRIPKEPP
jgi:hypothetical protein